MFVSMPGANSNVALYSPKSKCRLLAPSLTSKEAYPSGAIDVVPIETSLKILFRCKHSSLFPPPVTTNINVL